MTIDRINKQNTAHRREFLRNGIVASTGGVLASGITTRLFADPDVLSRTGNDANGIAELHLQTSKIDVLQSFYSQDLGFPTRRDASGLTIEAGSTRIVFESVESGESVEPFYHVAFNIPENKLQEARRWQKQRTELVCKGKSEVIHFAKWNADSVFFRDPAGNLLEYIARHDLDNASRGEFSSNDILYASEIGLVVDDVPGTVAAAKSELKMGIYRDNGANFASIGNEHALLIVVKRDRKWYPAKQRPAKVFPLSATIRRPAAHQLALNKLGYQISTK